MVWKTATRPEYPTGTNKIVPKFAWLPTYIDGNIIWLGLYQVIMIYETTYHETTISAQKVVFTNSKWVEASKRLIIK